MENEFDMNNFEVPLNIGIDKAVKNLLGMLGKNIQENQLERDFNYNYFQSYNFNSEKLSATLKRDIKTKGKLSTKEIENLFASKFFDLIFKKHLKKLSYIYFVMGYASNTEARDKVNKDLSKQLEKIFVELMELIREEAGENEFRYLYGPAIKNYLTDVHNDGSSYVMYSALETLKNINWK